MKKALLVIDMLNDFWKRWRPSLEILKDYSNVSSRISEYRSNGNPIIYIMDRHLPQDANLKCSASLYSGSGAEVVDELAPGKVISRFIRGATVHFLVPI